MISQDALLKLKQLEQQGDPTLISDLVNMFLSSTPEQLSALENSIRDGKVKELAAIAHPLKSSSATLGAMDLSETFAKIEARARTNDTGPEVLAMISKARKLFDEIVPELQKLIGNG